MAVIKRSDADRVARDAFVLDLADVTQRSRALVQRAEQDAERIIADAQAERDRLISDADARGHAEGTARGKAEGIELGRSEGRSEAILEAKQRLEELSGAWIGSLRSFESSREAMILAARSEVVELAAVIAGMVTKRVVQVDERVVADQIEAALRQLAGKSRVRISVSEADEPLAREVLPGLVAQLGRVEHAELVVDDGLGPGSCVVHTESGGRIDASIETQLARVLEEALPDASADQSADTSADASPDPSADDTAEGDAP
ncbi:MAG: FliH/SctL family protein [Planctomycetota bacterium]